MASYSNEQLQQVNELAAVFFTPREISIIMEMDEETFMDDVNREDHPLSKAFLSGKLKSEFEVRKSIVQLAKSGSSPAQAMSMELIKQNNLKMLDR